MSRFLLVEPRLNKVSEIEVCGIFSYQPGYMPAVIDIALSQISENSGKCPTLVDTFDLVEGTIRLPFYMLRQKLWTNKQSLYTHFRELSEHNAIALVEAIYLIL